MEDYKMKFDSRDRVLLQTELDKLFSAVHTEFCNRLRKENAALRQELDSIPWEYRKK